MSCTRSCSSSRRQQPVRGAQMVARLDTDGQRVWSLAFCLAAHAAVAGCHDGSLFVFDLDTWQCQQVLRGASGSGECMHACMHPHNSPQGGACSRNTATGQVPIANAT